MYSVMIVDDEALVRVTLRSFLENSAFTVRAEAAGGKQALERYRRAGHIDIVLTDVSMPGGDGLYLAEELLREKKPPLVVMLSGYNDYAYVRQAFKLGAADYILKSHMDRESLLRFLKDLADRTALPAQGEGVGIDREILLKAALDGIFPADDPQLQQAGVQLGRHAACAFAWIDDFAALADKYTESELEDFRQNVQRIIGEVGESIGGCALVSLSAQEYALAVTTHSASGEVLHNKINQALTQVHYCLRTYLNVTASIGLSRPGALPELPELYRAAQFNARLRYVFGKNRTIYPEQAERVAEGREFLILELGQELLAALEHGSEQDCMEEMQKLFHKVERVAGGGREQNQTAYQQIMFLLMKHLNDSGATMEDVFGNDMDLFSRMERFETREEIQNWLSHIAWANALFLRDKNNLRERGFIDRARDFIHKNYAEDISLHTVSEYVRFSESYFSARFIKATGQSFTDYLTQVRMEQARHLLDTTNLKAYEIGQRVGYANVEHFNRMFKKITGMSPGKYRNRQT